MRKQIIQHHLPDIYPFVGKYDYYIECRIIKKIEDDVKDFICISSRELLIFTFQGLSLHNLNTDEVTPFENSVRLFRLLSDRRVVTYGRPYFKVWSLDDLTEPQRRFKYDRHVSDIYILPNDTLVIYESNSKNIVMWDLYEDIITLTGHTNDIQCVLSFGNKLLTGSWDENIKVWNLDTYECEQTFIGHKTGIMTLNILNDNLIVSSDAAGEIRIWNREGECQRIIEADDVIKKILTLEDKLICINAHINTQDITIWSASTGHKQAVLKGHTSAITDIQLLPNNNIMSISKTELKIWNMYTCINQRSLIDANNFCVHLNQIFVNDRGKLIVIE